MSGATDAPPDWTSGPAKWVAVIILGASSLIGMGWSVVSSRAATPRTPVPAPLTRLPEPAPGRLAAVPAPATPLTRKINLNSASSAELQLLPGVGPAVAQRIIDHRAANGPFKRVEDLDNVKGIGPRTLEKLRELVSVE